MKDILRDLADRDQHNLKLQFQVGLGVILFCFCLFTATIIYHFQKNLLEEETLRQAELVMTSLESTRSYIREVLRPKMFAELGDDHFMIEAMSTSFITRVIMDRFTDELPDFKYRRVAIDARNPDFEANVQEREMIRFFQKNTQDQEWHGMTRVASDRYYTLYRPISFKRSCLHCHGKPAEAPSAILDLYGSSRGFQRDIGVVSGIQSISIPVEDSLSVIWQTSFRMFGIVLLLAGLLYGTIWLLFHQLIITNLRELVTLFKTSIDEDDSQDELYRKKGHREELRELFENARTLVSHLRESRSRLLSYADNLEVMVAERTEALEKSEGQLRVQVKKRNRELQLHNTLAGLITSTESLQSILKQVLGEVLQVVPVQGVGIYLSNAEGVFELRCSQGTDILPDVIPESATAGKDAAQQYITACDRITLNDTTSDETINISVPLCCRDQLQGILVITELPIDVLNDCLHALLLSIGRQIGQTVESLGNIQSLRRSSELLQSVVDGISDPLILLAPDGMLKMVNEAFLLRHNISRQEALGEMIDKLSTLPECLFKDRLQELDLTVKTPHTKEIQLEDGSIFDLFFYPIMRSENMVEEIVCFAKDVTGEKEAERRIQQTEKLVAIGQLAAGVAHEINNPLGVILCYTDIIKENNEENSEIIADIEIIDRHAENCRRIVADLLDFSRSKESQIERKKQSVNDSIENVLSMVQQQFLKQKIQLTTDLDATLPDCFIDERRIKQVFLNLIMNSVQAIATNGEISITSRLGDEQVLIEIKDNGPGIAKEIQDKIFDPFFSTKEPGQGTGLGLSVSYGIVREHDGEIKVSSVPEKGTVFTVSLPVSNKGVHNE